MWKWPYWNHVRKNTHILVVIYIFYIYKWYIFLPCMILIVNRTDLCAELPPLSSPPSLCSPRVRSCRFFPADRLWVPYVNSFPIKMLSKQIFRQLQREEVANKLKRRNQFAVVLSALIVGRTGSRKGCVPAHRYYAVCWGGSDHWTRRTDQFQLTCAHIFICKVTSLHGHAVQMSCFCH